MNLRIQTAAGRWAALTASLDEGDHEELETVERTILKSRPRCTQDAVVILDVVTAGIQAGQRSDGLDAKALQAVSRLLRTVP